MSQRLALGPWVARPWWQASAVPWSMATPRPCTAPCRSSWRSWASSVPAVWSAFSPRRRTALISLVDLTHFLATTSVKSLPTSCSSRCTCLRKGRSASPACAAPDDHDQRASLPSGRPRLEMLQLLSLTHTHTHTHTHTKEEGKEQTDLCHPQPAWDCCTPAAGGGSLRWESVSSPRGECKPTVTTRPLSSTCRREGSPGKSPPTQRPADRAPGGSWS